MRFIDSIGGRRSLVGRECCLSYFLFAKPLCLGLYDLRELRVQSGMIGFWDDLADISRQVCGGEAIASGYRCRD